MHRREMKDEARMILEPLLQLLARMHFQIVADQVDRGDGCGQLALQLFKEGDEFRLPFALVTRAVNPARARVEGRVGCLRGRGCSEVFSSTASSCRASSRQSHCDSERPRDSGLSQASLTSCTATSGGKKNGLAPAPGLIGKAVQAPLAEAPEPFLDGAAPNADAARETG
jgi:hypothetical protein